MMFGLRRANKWYFLLFGRGDLDRAYIVAFINTDYT